MLVVGQGHGLRPCPGDNRHLLCVTRSSIPRAAQQHVGQLVPRLLTFLAWQATEEPAEALLCLELGRLRRVFEVAGRPIELPGIVPLVFHGRERARLRGFGFRIRRIRCVYFGKRLQFEAVLVEIYTLIFCIWTNYHVTPAYSMVLEFVREHSRYIC